MAPPLAKAILLFLLGTATTAGAQFLRAESSSSLKAAARRALQDKSSNSDLCPSIANGDPRPETMDPCVFRASDNGAACEYGPTHQCKGSEAVYTYGCHCMDAVFMCFSMAMLPCDDGGGGGQDQRGGAGILPYDPKGEDEGTMKILPYDPKEEDEETMKILPYDPKEKDEETMKILPFDPKEKDEETMKILPYDPKEEDEETMKILPYDPKEKDEETMKILPFDPEEKDEETMKILPFEPEPAATDICPCTVPSDSDKCSRDTPARCDYEPIYCPGEPEPHHKWSCYCEGGKFVCVINTVICDTDEEQVQTKSILQNPTKEVTTRPIFNDDVVITSCPENPIGKTACSGDFGYCGYGSVSCPGSSITHHDKECSCEDGRFLCYQLALSCEAPKPEIEVNVVDTCPKLAPKDGDDLRCSTAVSNCLYDPFQCNGSSINTHYTKECQCVDGRFECFVSAIYCPQTCEDCGNMHTKGMKRKRQECSTLKRKRIDKMCQKSKWIKRKFCAETCINAGHTVGREECCVGDFTREN